MPDLVGAVRDNYVYVTLFFLLRHVVFLFYRDPEEVLPEQTGPFVHAYCTCSIHTFAWLALVILLLFLLLDV